MEKRISFTNDQKKNNTSKNKSCLGLRRIGENK